MIAPSPTIDGDRAVTLDDDRRIIIRPVHRRDDVHLMTLYGSLDDDDQYRRFFSSYQPPFSFFTEMATVDQRGGARLVAVLRGTPPTEDRIIGEAGYTMLPNGDGELGMIVARRWRGWLGPYLLDALVDVAAAAGVANLEADVLTVNRPMMAMLRSRGSVVMEHDGWSVVRLLIGTRNRTPRWPASHDRPRVLVEGAGGRWHAEDEARAAGLHVLNCPGPRDGPHGCPALAGKPCPLAAEADIIVVSHPPDEERWHDLLAAHANVHPGVPVCLEPSHLPVEDDTVATVCPVAGEEAVVSFVRQLARPTATRDEPDREPST